MVCTDTNSIGEHRGFTESALGHRQGKARRAGRDAKGTVLSRVEKGERRGGNEWDEVSWYSSLLPQCRAYKR